LRIPIESSTTYRGRNSRPQLPVLATSIGAALAVGALTAAVSPFGSPTSARWFEGLAKPAWEPPASWFGPWGLVLYVLMGAAAWLIWRERYHRGRSAALAAYAIQLLLNAAWAPLFFGAANIGAGLFVIVALCLAIVWTMREFAVVKGMAAWLLLPYLIGVGFVSALNLAIWKLNQ